MSAVTTQTALLNLVGQATPVEPAAAESESLEYHVQLSPGIYRLSGHVDMSQFDFDRLYYPMDKFNNKGQITGPWDFDLRSHNEPLVPAWWLWINDERLGLACTQRPGTEQLGTKVLQLSNCFEVRQAGEVRIRLEPYKSAVDVELIQLQLTAASEQEPTSLSIDGDVTNGSHARHLFVDGAFDRWKQTIEADENLRKLFPRMLAAAKKISGHGTPVLTGGKPQLGAEALPLLAFAHHAYGDEDALGCILRIVKGQVEREVWGNPYEDGYSHNCDMVAAEVIEPLSFVYHWAAEPLKKAGLHEALRDKLEFQMKRFFTLLLLWENYWGGSLLQDHGHRSAGRFGVAAINMLGVLEDAPRWAGFIANRMSRVLSALPIDGGMPFTSYMHIHLYMDDMLTWRDAYQHLSGEDIFDDKLFESLVGFVVNRLHEPSMRLFTAVSRGDRKDFYAGWGFFNAIAALHGDGCAKRMTQLLVDRYLEQENIPIRPVSTFLAMVNHQSDVQPVALSPQPFDVRADSGSTNYRLTRPDVNVSIRCAAPPAISAYYKSFCPCDRIIDAQLEGHFTVAVNGRMLLLTAEGGYRMRASLGSVLHIDGKGAWGDADHPMGACNAVFRGQYIEASRYDEATGNAYLRLRLDPAYPREAKLIRYHREFFLRPDGLRCRDLVICQEPHEYSWHFQTYADHQIESLGNQAYRVTERDASLTLTGRAVQTQLVDQVADTDVVWAYGNENDDRAFRHIHYVTQEHVGNLTAEFDVAW